MELIKRNIHMDRVKRSTVMQFTMEEDLNLPEDKPDISTLNLEKGEVVIEEICPGTDEVTVRGKLGYADFVSHAGVRKQSGTVGRRSAF